MPGIEGNESNWSGCNQTILHPDMPCSDGVMGKKSVLHPAIAIGYTNHFWRSLVVLVFLSTMTGFASCTRPMHTKDGKITQDQLDQSLEKLHRTATKGLRAEGASAGTGLDPQAKEIEANLGYRSSK